MTDDKEYKELLQQQFKRLLKKIDDIAKRNNNFIPTDAFLFRLSNNRIPIQDDNVEWLEMAIDKLTNSLATIEKYDLREEYKKTVGVDLASKMKYL